MSRVVHRPTDDVAEVVTVFHGARLLKLGSRGHRSSLARGHGRQAPAGWRRALRRARRLARAARALAPPLPRPRNPAGRWQQKIAKS